MCSSAIRTPKMTIEFRSICRVGQQVDTGATYNSTTSFSSVSTAQSDDNHLRPGQTNSGCHRRPSPAASAATAVAGTLRHLHRQQRQQQQKHRQQQVSVAMTIIATIVLALLVGGNVAAFPSQPMESSCKNSKINVDYEKEINMEHVSEVLNATTLLAAKELKKIGATVNEYSKEPLFANNTIMADRENLTKAVWKGGYTNWTQWDAEWHRNQPLKCLLVDEKQARSLPVPTDRNMKEDFLQDAYERLIRMKHVLHLLNVSLEAENDQEAIVYFDHRNNGLNMVLCEVETALQALNLRPRNVRLAEKKLSDCSTSSLNVVQYLCLREFIGQLRFVRAGSQTLWSAIRSSAT